MCGITGLFAGASGNRLPQPELVHSMNDAIVHRGPDDQGIFIDRHVALGHRRLSIIDVSGGQQPIFNEDRSVVLIYNGEIYNYMDLRKELLAAGHEFRTNSDSEVVVHAWEEWREACVERFRGMFAFAIWDSNSSELFLARDRLGVKPLFYSSLKDGQFVFGSELKALQVLPNFNRDLSTHAIEEYFAFGYVPDPNTIYSSTFKLSPGHTLTYKLGDSKPRIRQYWDIRIDPTLHISERDAVHELAERLSAAVKMRLVSEVPLGAFLSGGIDSGTVVALMAMSSTDPVTTCSIGFTQAGYDESEYAKSVASRYRTNHHHSIVDGDDFDLAGQIVSMYDEPFADSSAIPTFRVCQMARQHVTVALSGDGGDETFGGYRRYGLHLMEERIRAFFPGVVRRKFLRPLGEVFPKLDYLPRPFRAKTTIQSIARSTVDGYFNSMCLLRDADRHALYTGSFRSELAGYNAKYVFEQFASKAEFSEPLALIQYLDYKTYLPGDINAKVDRASMANSLEVRDPLMDHELVEWMGKLPQRLKIQGGDSKYLLKRVANDWLPEELLKRRKMGFAVPVDSWLRGPEGGQMLDDLLDGPAVQSGFIDRNRLSVMANEHRSMRRIWSAPIWATYCFNEFLLRDGH